MERPFLLASFFLLFAIGFAAAADGGSGTATVVLSVSGVPDASSTAVLRVSPSSPAALAAGQSPLSCTITLRQVQAAGAEIFKQCGEQDAGETLLLLLDQSRLFAFGQPASEASPSGSIRLALVSPSGQTGSGSASFEVAAPKDYDLAVSVAGMELPGQPASQFPATPSSPTPCATYSPEGLCVEVFFRFPTLVQQDPPVVCVGTGACVGDPSTCKIKPASSHPLCGNAAQASPRQAVSQVIQTPQATPWATQAQSYPGPQATPYAPFNPYAQPFNVSAFNCPFLKYPPFLNYPCYSVAVRYTSCWVLHRLGILVC